MRSLSCAMATRMERAQISSLRLRLCMRVHRAQPRPSISGNRPIVGSASTTRSARSTHARKSYAGAMKSASSDASERRGVTKCITCTMLSLAGRRLNTWAMQRSTRPAMTAIGRGARRKRGTARGHPEAAKGASPSTERATADIRAEGRYKHRAIQACTTVFIERHATTGSHLEAIGCARATYTLALM